jgi:hypothetical protein
MADQGLSFRDAMGYLAEQKTLAESHGGQFKRNVIQQTALLDGERLYDEAKAKFDGLIERLLVDLANEREPKQSAELRTAFEAAVERRIAFSQSVHDRLAALEGVKDLTGFGDALKAGADVINKLIEAGVEIWKEYRRGDDLRRDTIRNQIKGTRWRPFGEL